jgi:hypothetical protein
VLNKTSHQAPDGNVSGSLFGHITTFYPAQEMKGGLKLIF